jgi:hypothetical protein
MRSFKHESLWVGVICLYPEPKSNGGALKDGH